MFETLEGRRLMSATPQDSSAELANVSMDAALTQQSQSLRMMSNISKMLFDTAQAVIRKFGG